MEDKGKYGAAWIEGFTKAAMSIGAAKDTTKKLLKIAAVIDSFRDPEFIDGFKKEASAAGISPEALAEATLVKEAAGWGKLLAGLGLGAAGMGGAMMAGNAVGDWQQRNMGRDEYGRQYYDLMQLANSGQLRPEEATSILRKNMINRAQGDLGLMGHQQNGNAFNPYVNWFGSSY